MRLPFIGKSCVLALVCTAMHTAVLAQSEHSSTGRGGVANTFVSDYQAIGINPANLGRSSHRLSFSFLEGGLSISSSAFTRDIISGLRDNNENTDESLAKRKAYAKAFASDNVLNFGAELNTFAVSVNLPKIGSFALSNRQRMLGHAGFNKNFSELLFLGQSAPVVKEYGADEPAYVSDIFAGTELKSAWVQEWNIAFGRKLLSLPGATISGGVGYRYVRGLAVGEFSVINGQITTYAAVSPTLALGNEAYTNKPLSTLLDVGKRLTPVGQGHGFDVGFSADIAKKVKVGVSVTDIGAIHWTEKVMVGEDRGFILSELESNEQNSFDSALDMAEQIVNTSMEFTPQDEVKTDLPTRLRLGVGLSLASNVELGLDYVHALNDAPGNLTEDFIGFGIDVMPAKFLRLSSGVSTGAGEKFNLPVGIALVTPVYEFGLSTRDITAPLSGEDPGVSLAVAFLRFKVGRL